MKSKIAVIGIGIVLTLAVTSCAPGTDTTTLNPVRASNQNTVVIQFVAFPDVALDYASQECAKYNRTARLVKREEDVGWIIFDCVP